MTDRQLAILEQLNQFETVSVTELAQQLQTAGATIRKDLVSLEEQGLLRRQHGGAKRVSRRDVGYRMIFEYDIKKRIADRAAQMVSHGETIMIESGSTCAMLAEVLAKTRHDVTIITNSAFISGHIRMIPGIRIILLGGTYDPEAQVMTGPLARMCAETFHVDKFFIGTDGYCPDQGFYNEDISRADTVRSMAKQATNRIILTTAQKFNRRSDVLLMPEKDVSMIITDEVPDNCRKKLETSGVEIVLAEASNAKVSKIGFIE